jgi:plastocyanin
MIAAVAVVVAATGATAPPAPAAEGARVLMVDNEPDLTNWHFAPADVTIAVGSTVVWHNDGQQDHTVTADDGSFDSGTEKPGADWQRTFSKPGQYTYHCLPHPWMKGTVKVGSAAALVTSSSTAITTTTMPPPTTAATAPASNAAPAGSRKDSGSPTGVIALGVAAVALGALAVGAKLRRSRP